jgi:GNAT superfamily N-acetyltransferase
MREYVDRVWGWDDEDIGLLIVEERADELYLAEIQLLPAWQGLGIGRVNERALYERLGMRVYDEIDTHAYLRRDVHPAP